MTKDAKTKVIRPWGFFTNLMEGEGFLVKIIHINAGQRLSVQSHNHRSEHWVVVKGTVEVLLNGEKLTLSRGEFIDIPIKAIHSIQSPPDEESEVIEIQRGEILSEDDIIRYEDLYGRV